MNFKQFEAKLRKERPNFIKFLKKNRILGIYLKNRKAQTGDVEFEFFPDVGREISGGFHWASTIENHDFWGDLNDEWISQEGLFDTV